MALVYATAAARVLLAVVAPAICTTSARAADICRSFLDVHPGSGIGNDFVTTGDFDVDGDGRPEHVTASDFGTAHISVFTMTDTHGVSHRMDTPVNEDGGGYVGRWFVDKGRGYLVTFADEDEKYIRGLFEISNDYKPQLLCAFANHVNRISSPRRPQDKAICEASDAGLPPGLEKNALRPDTKGWPYSDDKSTSPLFPVSLDNAGTKLRVAQVVVDFGGGRGCDYDYFVPAAEAPAHQRELLESLQERGDYSPRPSACPNTRFSWFTFMGKTYLRSRPARVKVSDAFDDADRVSGVVDGVPRRVCSAIYIVTWTLDEAAH